MAKTDTHKLLNAETARYLIGNRTESTALLAWFLETVWRLDPDMVEDAICDGGNDKGIDALDVDTDLKEIIVFQAKRYQSHAKTQGDKDLKQFIGAAHYFEDAGSIQTLLDSKPNSELVKLLARHNVAKNLESGDWLVRLVFVTNAVLDSAGVSYVRSRDAKSPPLDVWDRDRLRGVADRTKSLAIKDETVTLELGSTAMIESLDGKTRMAVALVPAPTLVRLPGIDDLSLFELNVRLGLGKTRINKDLAATIGKSDEHSLFPAYHNGLTLLSRRVTIGKKEMTLDGVSVVNGCQSLLQLYGNRASVTPGLRVLVKVIELGDSLDLADVITYRTNNQNAVNQRDLRSTDATQRDLQRQVAEKYGSELAYRIRAGEDFGTTPTLDNTAAAQLIMAVYVQEPWNAVRKVRLFDQEYHRIFSRDITGHHLYLLFQMDKIVTGLRRELREELQASFASVRLTLLYLLGQALRLLPPGDDFLAKPEQWLPDQLDEVKAQLTELTHEVITELDIHVGDMLEKDALFDPKVAFKSKAGVAPAEREVERTVKRARRRNDSYGFTLATTPMRVKGKLAKKVQTKKVAAGNKNAAPKKA